MKVTRRKLRTLIESTVNEMNLIDGDISAIGDDINSEIKMILKDTFVRAGIDNIREKYNNIIDNLSKEELKMIIYDEDYRPLGDNTELVDMFKGKYVSDYIMGKFFK